MSDQLTQADLKRIKAYCSVPWADHGCGYQANDLFVLSAAEDLPRLVAEVERLRAENERLRAVLAEYADLKNWACRACMFDRPHIARECVGDWWQGGDDGYQHGYTLAREALDGDKG